MQHYCFGKVAPTAGMPEPLIASSLSAALQAAAKALNTYVIQADAKNTGRIFILTDSNAADTVAYSNVKYVLDPGATFGGQIPGVNAIQLHSLYVDCETTGDFCATSGEQA